ncbi:hypothetical protein Tco_0064032 [Tanacetum coccineum]
MSLTKSLFKRLKNSFKVEGTQHERKIIFSHGIGEAMVETSKKKIVIPCVLYIPKITLNVLSLDQLMAQGFVVTYGHNKCQISYMFEEDKEGCDGETDFATSKEGNGYDVEIEKVLVIHGLTKAHAEDLKTCYKQTIDMVKFCYDTTLRPWFKEEPVKCEKTKKVEGGYDHAKEKNPQEHDGSSNNDTDVDQMANQEDGANTSETDDFMPVQQWYQSRCSKSWEKPIHNQMQKGFEKGYLLREGDANTLPRSSQKKQLSHECKEMLRRKLNEIEA